MQNLIKALLANFTADASSKVDFPIYYYIFLSFFNMPKHTFAYTHSLSRSYSEMPKRPVEINTFVIRFAERNEMEEETSTTTAAAAEGGCEEERKKNQISYTNKFKPMPSSSSRLLYVPISACFLLVVLLKLPLSHSISFSSAHLKGFIFCARQH